jgi:hypothetical protein
VVDTPTSPEQGIISFQAYFIRAGEGKPVIGGGEDALLVDEKMKGINVQAILSPIGQVMNGQGQPNPSLHMWNASESILSFSGVPSQRVQSATRLSVHLRTPVKGGYAHGDGNRSPTVCYGKTM